MTTDHSVGGTALAVSPASGLQRSLRSSTKARAEAERLEEVALMKEEDKLMDEEVTSEEEEDSEETERAMIQVALAKSVVETNTSQEDASDASDSSPKRYGLRKRRRPTGQDLERLEHYQSTTDGGLARGKLKSTPPSTPRAVVAPAPSPTKPAPRTKPEAVVCAFTVPIANETPVELHSLTSVPNPLSKHIHPPIVPGAKALKPEATSNPSVPCPLPPPTQPSAPLESTEKRVVTFQTSETRMRGFSIDLDLGSDFGDDTSAAVPANSGGGRDRAFSFECFAFGINADEPLPPLEHGGHSNSGTEMLVRSGRPRGDSIIFDPASFQDGGIHEQNALERHREENLDTESATPELAPSVGPKPAPATLSSVHSAPSTMEPSAAVVAVTCSSLTSSSVAALSLELLNKDGRIGIYLPEARRARIARFHAKRSRRIWRKRIKYDCRKKLADSRPRIKGRFVKRSDMDD